MPVRQGHRRWTDAEDLQLARMVENKRSEAEMASRLKRTVEAIHQRKARVGLGAPGRTLEPEEIASIRRLRRQGHSYQEIADRTGRGRETVRRVVRGLDQRTAGPRARSHCGALGPAIGARNRGVKPESDAAAAAWAKVGAWFGGRPKAAGGEGAP